MRIWRLTPAKYATTAFNGFGAKVNGGRWNSPGTSVVYLSATLSLSALETLVHADPTDLPDHVSISVGVPDEITIENVDPAALSPHWRDELPPAELRAFGDAWVKEARSVLLRVPSVIVPDEFNYVLNPAHPDFEEFDLGSPRAFVFDPRLIAKS